MELNSSQTSSIFSYHPLFSSIITLYILIFLYFPCNSLKLIVSPILISTLILLLSLLRLGISQQRLQQQQKQHANIVEPELEPEPKCKNENDFEPVFNPEPEPEYENNNEFEFVPEPEGIQQLQQHENIVESESEPEPKPQYENNNESEFEPEPEGIQQQHENIVESEPEPESENENEFEFEFKPELINKTSITLGIQPKPKHEPSFKSSLSQEEEKVETHCDRAEIQPITNHGFEHETKQIINTDITNKEDKQTQPNPVTDPFPYSTQTFVGWAVCAPLEVIYESYEGEEDLEDMYVESGTDTDTDTDTCSSSTWEEEEDKEGMFEIALDNGYGDSNNKSVLDMKKVKNELEVDDEDNLIEINISF